MDKKGHIVELVNIYENKLMFYIFFPIEFFIIKKTGIGFKIHQVIRNIKIINSYDQIVAINDSIALPILLLKKLHIIKTSIIYISVGLRQSFINDNNKILLYFIAHCSKKHQILYPIQNKSNFGLLKL